MRFAFITLLVLLSTQQSAAPAGKRYEIEADLKTYPQSNPKETLPSIIKAVEAKRADYVLAHLADPLFVDRSVKENGGRFDLLVEEAKAKLIDDPGAIKQLRKFVSDGEWKSDDNTASVRLKDVSDRAIYLRKIGDRWYMENRRKPEPVKKTP